MVTVYPGGQPSQKRGTATPSVISEVPLKTYLSTLFFFYLRENMKHYTQRLPNNAPGKTSTTSKLNWKYAVESRGTGSTLIFSHRYITVL